MTGELTLLIDGDVVAYRAASRVQKVEQDGDGYVRPFAYLPEGEASVDSIIMDLMDGLGASHMRVVLSDPEANWRHNIMPTYKRQRTADEALLTRPLLLGRLKEYLRVKYGAFSWPGLEADDTLGILMTSETPTYARVLVGRDKDFRSIPGRQHTIGDTLPDGSPRVVDVTPWEADRFHMVQTLAGDRVDGYPGCPGIGMERAWRIIKDPQVLVPKPGVVTRGPRKGTEITKWVAEPTGDYWACIVSHYAKEGQTEADALTTARVARILRAEDYDAENDRIVLWTPDRLDRWSSGREG